MKKGNISSTVIRRMPRYYRHLEALQKKGIQRISSNGLSLKMGLTASQIRQDLANFGEFGLQGYGYSVDTLLEEIAHILGMNNDYTAVMVGVGRLGTALLANFPFKKYGVHIVAAYDVDPGIVGTAVFGVPVYDVGELQQHLAENSVDVAILTAPKDVAHWLANVLGTGKVKGIWNYTNVELHPREGDPVIEDVHIFDSLFSLCCLINGYEDD